MVNIEAMVGTLRDAGLEPKEAEVYISLLRLGTATAYRIAELSGLKKPTVYVILEDLRQKGLTLKIPHAKKALFSVRDLGEYLRERKKKIANAEALLPKLAVLGGTQQPNVYFYTGMRGIAEAIDFKFERMRGKTYHCIYGSLEGCDPSFSKLYGAWDKKALSADMLFKIVMPREKSGVFYKYMIAYAKTSSNVEIRFIEKSGYPPDVSMLIGEDFVCITDEKNVQGVVIDNAGTADAMRRIFNIVWQVAAM